jgi:hypothetical protein
MSGAPPVKVAIERLASAYDAWPGDDHDKTAQMTLLLRLRIEAVVRALPPTVIVAAPSGSAVRRRLALAIGEPGLDPVRRTQRIATVRAAATAYEALCDVLHGRNPENRPPLTDVREWRQIVAALEAEFGQVTVPEQRNEAADSYSLAGAS